jgi:hypothetical protein
MTISKPTLLKTALAAAVAAGTLAATAASAATYTVCNRWDECWQVRDRYKAYPPDVTIVYRDEAWRAAHENDTHYKWLKVPDDDHGWFDEGGVWHSFPPAP